MDFRLTTDPLTGQDVLDVPFTGPPLLVHPLFNKGSAFSEAERRTFDLLGLLPAHINTLADQTARRYQDYQLLTSDLQRYIYLRDLQDRNEVLFYRLLQEHPAEMLPVVYTPVVGAACQTFSHIYRRPRGLFLPYPFRDDLDAMLDNRRYREVDVVVVTDGERILGLGDQGAGGMGIPVGKLSLYTLCGGIHPARTLPVLLDVGTDNEELHRDPLYLGWRHHRVRGPEYDAFIEAFAEAVCRKLPNVLLQWEDFALCNAHRLLERYRDRLCSFNDDIQGTAAVALAGLLAAARASGGRLRDQRVLIVGAGSAGTGISEAVVRAMQREGLNDAEARALLWLYDRPGPLLTDTPGLLPFQRPLAQPPERAASWPRGPNGIVSLLETVKHLRPTVLLGVSGQPGLFTEAVVRGMAGQRERPILFPLSNPTARSEAQPADLLAWTDGRALIATGSPFPPVLYRGRQVRIGQCNNCYIFPGMGLGVIAAGARRVSDEMFLAAAFALAECSPAPADPNAPLFPPLEDIRAVSQRIALAVAAKAQWQGLADETTPEELARRVQRRMWVPDYPGYRR